jgi:dihydrofolate synthase/folylpolyglutamate synthase
LAGIFQILAPHFDHVFLTRYRGNRRGVPPEELARLLSQVAGLPFTVREPALQAWQSARASAAPGDLICITGSVFLAGELRPHLLDTAESVR